MQSAGGYTAVNKAKISAPMEPILEWGKQMINSKVKEKAAESEGWAEWVGVGINYNMLGWEDRNLKPEG